MSYRVGKIQLRSKPGRGAFWVSAFIRDNNHFAIHLDHLGRVVVSHYPSGSKMPAGPWKDFSIADRYCDLADTIRVDWDSPSPSIDQETSLRLRQLRLDIVDEQDG